MDKKTLTRLGSPAAMAVAFFALFACGARPEAPAAAAAAAGGGARAVAPAERAGPSPDALRVAARLRARGGLRSATTETVAIYEKMPDGSVAGFQSELAAAFADWLGVPLILEAVDFEDFFAVEEGSGGEPKIFSRYDLIVHSLASTPSRERLMRVVPVLPNRIMTVTRKGEEIASLRELQGKRVAVMTGTSYDLAARDARAQLGLDFEIVNVPFEADIYAEILEGRADIALRDANAAVARARTATGLSVAVPISDMQMTGWALGLRDGGLASTLQEFLAESKADGTFASLFRRSMGLELDDYYTLIRYREGAEIPLTPAQAARIGGIRSGGGLRVAIDSELTVYEPERGGGASRGFHYDLVVRFCRDFDLPLRLEPVRFDAFFSSAGTVPERAKSDPSFAYVPDLLRRSDLYVATLSPLPWRRKFLRFSPLFPTTLVYMARSGTRIEAPSDLEGLRVSLLPNTTYESWLKDRSRELGTAFRYLLVDTGSEAVAAVAEGRADVTVSDANLAFARFREHGGLTMYPASDEVDIISWAVARDDEALGAVLDAWIAAVKEDGTFERLWKGYYGVSFASYLGLLGPER